MTLRILRHISTKSVKFVGEAILVVGGVTILAVLGAAWRLSTHPLDIGFAKETIENALGNSKTGVSVSIGNAFLVWSDIKQPLYLRLGNVTLLSHNKPILSVDGVDVGVMPHDLVIGNIAPVAFIVSTPALRVIRTADNKLRLALQDETDPEGSETPVLQRIIEAIGDRGVKSSRDNPLRSLRRIEIHKARMVVEDHRLGVSWFLPELDLLFLHDAQGLVATVQANLPGTARDDAALRLDMRQNQVDKSFAVNMHLQNVDPRFLSRKIEDFSFLDNQDFALNGDVGLVVGDDMTIRRGNIKLQSNGGQISLPDLYDAPLPFQALNIDAAYNIDTGAAIRNASLTVGDVTLTAEGFATIGKAGVVAPVTLKIANVPHEKIEPLFPKAFKETTAAHWILRRLSKGTVRDAAVHIAFAAFEKEKGVWSTAVEGIKAEFAVDGMHVDYVNPLLPVMDADAHGTYKKGILDIVVDRGTLGDMRVEKGRVRIDNIDKPDQLSTIDISAALNGSLATVFHYISREPIAVGKETTGVHHTDVKGNAALTVDISLPAVHDVKKKDVKITVNGTASDVFLPRIVHGLDLSAKALTVSIKDGLIDVSGNGSVSTQPTTLRWKQYMDSTGKPFSSQTTASLIADEALRRQFGVNLDEWITGDVPVGLTYTTFANGRAEAAIRADLKPVIFSVEQLEYTKPPNTDGTATCTAVLQNAKLRDIQALTIKTPDLTIENAALGFEDESVLRRGSFPRLIHGETNIALGLEVAPQTRQMRVAIKGTSLDARPFLDKKEGKTKTDDPPLFATIDVTKLHIRPERSLDNVQLTLDMDAQGGLNRLDLDGTAGKGTIKMRLNPDASGKMNLSLEATDAGATLRTFDAYENMKGGKLSIKGQSKNALEKSLITGTANITNFKVVKAPVLARLVGLISPTGIPELLSGEGLSFARLETEFDWQRRQQGDLYKFRNGRTSGSSVGLTFEGSVDKAQNQMNIKGEIVPIAMVNDLISGIPLVGDILTGGGGALIAATYTVKGAPEKAEVSVNPLSALTPGFLRKILFETK
jgi:hypothetical protein